MKKPRTIKMSNGIEITIKESGENPPQGIIIDVWKKEYEEPIDSYTLWYSDYEEED